MQAFIKNIILLSFVFAGGFLWAQKDTTDIDTQKLIIVTPYSPTVSDAVKIKQKPNLDNEKTELEKKKINYDIYSFPVASTFTPEKGRASGVKRIAQPNLYDSYAALGIGNYTNITAEFYTDLEVGDRQRFTIDLSHLSSQGGVKKIPLKGKDKFFDTQFGMGFKAEADNFYWGAKVGLLHQQYNWYGIMDNIFSDYELKEINPTHNYIGLGLGGNLEMKKGILDKVDLKFQHFRDDFDSAENRIALKPNFRFDVEDNNLNTEFTIDYLNGKFKDRGLAGDKNYSHLNLGIYPSYNYDYGDLSFTIGFEGFYSSDLENSNSKFYIHPKLKASYHIAEEFLTAYAGIDGNLKQNSYFEFTQDNPYVAPQLWIAPTHTPFDVFVGGKGMLTDELFYDLRAGYKSVKNQPLFHGIIDDYPMSNSGFTYNNSFMILYQDVKSFYFQPNLEYKMNDDLQLGMSMTFANHSVNKRTDIYDFSMKAWNLPSLEARMTGDYKITDQWNVGAALFYVGQREDFKLAPDGSRKTLKAKGYVDANLRVNYQLNDQLGFFLKGHNLFNDNYDIWYNYKSQGIQLMIGASYQF